MNTHCRKGRTVKSLFNASDNKEIIDRIYSLTAVTKAEWGKMDVAQMLAHAGVPLRTAFGELKLRRSLMGVLFGGIAKRMIISGEPFKKNSPTAREFVVTGKRNFEEEKKSLIALVHRFSDLGPTALTKEPHPFFGKMNSNEWDLLMWKHLDHHLRQFGA